MKTILHFIFYTCKNRVILRKIAQPHTKPGKMSRIAESELIINDRGAVYHLNCRPEEIATTIITVGDPDRVSEVSKYFDQIEYKNNHREFVTHTGWLGKKRISCVSTGIGPDNIDIVLNELDALANIDLETRLIKEELTCLNIIRFGTSGSLQKEIPVDSFVASTHGLGLDNLMHFYRADNNEEEKQLMQAFNTHTQLSSGNVSPYITMASGALIKHFTQNYTFLYIKYIAQNLFILPMNKQCTQKTSLAKDV